MADSIHEGAGFEAGPVQYDYAREVFERNQKISEAGLKRWEILNREQGDQEKQFDKYAMTIAAGSFGVSFAFIDRIIPIQNAVYRPVLAAAWALFGFCMLVMLIGYRISSIIHRAMAEEEKQNIENAYKNEPFVYKTRSVFFNPAEVCNNLALITNSLGIVCLILFVYLNF